MPDINALADELETTDAELRGLVADGFDALQEQIEALGARIKQLERREKCQT